MEQINYVGILHLSFVETSDVFSTVSVHADPNVTVEDFETVRAAMKQIESKLGKPAKGHPWLFIARDKVISDLSVYLLQSLFWKDISGLGNIYILHFISSGYS